MSADWAMVWITLVYVVATIFICVANLRSAKATREQLAESKRQFDEENRAFITYSFIYEHKAIYGLRFTNNGKRVAKHIRVEFKQEFIDSLENDDWKKGIVLSRGKECILGIGQSFDIFFGGSKFCNNTNKTPIEGTIIYSDENNRFEEPFFIDFNNYPPIFTVDTDEEEIRVEIKKQTAELERIRKELQKMNQVKKQEKDHA